MSHLLSPGKGQFVANQKENAMKRPIEDGLSLLAGLGVGTALMYLLDPESGSERRQMISQATRSGLSSARETFADTAESLAERARGAASSLSSGASEHADYARSLASDYGSRLRRSAGSMMPSFQRQHHASAGEYAGYAAGGLALFALGAGLAYLFDPDRGRTRRAYIGQQISGRTSDVTEFARRTGKHWSNKARGYASQAQTAAMNLKDKVASSTGMSSSDSSSNTASQGAEASTTNTM
jgi:hypothetical protein